MEFEDKLNIYAKLIVEHGANIQKGQLVYIDAEIEHLPLVRKLAERAYLKGAKHVNVGYSDPFVAYYRVENASLEDMAYVPAEEEVSCAELVDTNAAYIGIDGSTYPDLFKDSPVKKLNARRIASRKASDYFYSDGINKNKIHWTIAAAATEGWAKKVFPGIIDPQEAKGRLWNEIFFACRADRINCLELWKEHNEVLHARARGLTNLKIKTLIFKGPGTNLEIGLSPLAQWWGGGEVGPHGVEFEPNLPTEECFTTPDHRLTNGIAKITRPFYANGKLIEDLSICFKDGVIKDWTCSAESRDTWGEYLDSDPGAKRLGEVALVGIDSPIYQSGHLFQNTLFDENAACHMAIGDAYTTCIKGGIDMSKEELKSVGCNDSSVHTDMMISNNEVDVIATTYDGKTVKLIDKGIWTEWQNNKE